jgi:hypothetical protein
MDNLFESKSTICDIGADVDGIAAMQQNHG